jgi:plasmid stabilization system protein ParE
MSSIDYSDSALVDLQRLYDFLAQFDRGVAAKATKEIHKSIGFIKLNPTLGTPVPDRPFIRKVVVDFGASGYLIFHKRYEKSDTNFILRILHQKECYEFETIGIEEERES